MQYQYQYQYHVMVGIGIMIFELFLFQSGSLRTLHWTGRPVPWHL